MSLELYRRHNSAKCKSSDTVRCANKRRPCPIWIRGTKPDGTYMREPTGKRDWNEAEKFKSALQTTGEPPKPPAGKATVELLCERFIKNMETESKDIETIRKYEQLFRKLKEFATRKGILFATDFDLTALEEFRSEWPDGDLSRQKKQERLRALFRYARSRKMVAENPAIDLGKITVKHKQKIPFTDEELAAIEKAAIERIEDDTRSDDERKRSRRAYALILLMRYTGLRISDATLLARSSLKGDHIDLVTEKTGSPVSVLVGEPVIEALQSFVPETKTHFFWDGKLSVKSLTNLYRDFYIAPVLEAAEVTGKTPHSFRHTFATRLLTKGVSVENVASLLGNSPKIIWKTYAAWIPARQEALDKAVRIANGWHHLEPTSKRTRK